MGRAPSPQAESYRFSLLGALSPTITYGHVRTDTELWQCTLVGLYNAASFGDQAAGTMTHYPTQSHYPDTEIISLFSILVVELKNYSLSFVTWLGKLSFYCITCRKRVSVCQSEYFEYVVVCTDLSSKEPHIQVGVSRVVTSGSLDGDWLAHWPGMQELWVRFPV